MTNNVPDIPNYRIVKEIGRGGMATVYLAIQENFGRNVALKIMAPALSADAGFSSRFLREARIVSHLVHPHIVTVFDVGEYQNHHYLSMEYVDGDDLRQLRTQMTLRSRLRVVREIAQALDFAARKGYIHRDVKPENIMMHDDDGRAVLMDFGIARAADGDQSMTRTGTVIGTPHYISPEQAEGKGIDHRTDIYSLGVVLYQLLVGRVPYHADNSLAVVFKHLSEPIPRLPQKLRAFQPVVDKAMAKKPDDRFQTAAQLGAAIVQLEDRLSKGAPTSVPTQPIKQVGLGDSSTAEKVSLDSAADTLELQPGKVRRNRDREKIRANLNVPEAALRNQSPPEKRSRGKWVFFLLLVTIAGAAAGYHQGYIAPVEPVDRLLVEHLPNQYLPPHLQLSNRDEDEIQPKDDAPSLVLATDQAPASIEQLPTVEIKTSAVTEPQAQSIPDESRSPATGETSEELDSVASENSKMLRASELSQELESNADVLEELAGIYIDELNRSSDSAWAASGLGSMQAIMLDKVAGALEEDDLGSARVELDRLGDLVPETLRVSRYSKLRNDLATVGQVRDLLLAANQQLLQKTFDRPEGANALESFQSVLELQPQNLDAQKGISQVVEQLVRLASAQFAKARISESEKIIARGLAIEEDNSSLLKLKRQIAAAKLRRQQISQLLQEAQILRTGDQLINPPNRNALERYRRVLKLDSTNSESKKAINEIARTLTDRISELIGTGDLDNAEDQLSETRDRFPRNNALIALQGSLEETKETMQQARIEASRPKINQLRVSGRSISSITAPQQAHIKAGRTIHVAIRYINLPSETSVIQAALYDGGRSLQMAQTSIIVNGSSGSKIFKIDRPVEGFPDGTYHIDLMLGDQQLGTGSFKVENKNNN